MKFHVIGTGASLLKVKKLLKVFAPKEETQWNISLCTSWSFTSVFPEPASSLPHSLVSAPSFSSYPGTAPCSERNPQFLGSASLPSGELESPSTLSYSLFKYLTSFSNSACMFQLHSSAFAEQFWRKSLHTMVLHCHPSIKEPLPDETFRIALKSFGVFLSSTVVYIMF